MHWLATVSFLSISLMPLIAPAAHSQEQSSRPVTLVVPLAAGGGVDSVARLLAPRLAAALGTSVVVENRVGGGTVVAASSVAKAAADGHTLLVAPSGTLAINPTLHKKLLYSADKDFTPVALLVSIPLVLVVNPALPINSLPDLVKVAKEQPGKLSFGSSGVGSSLHLAGELMMQMTETRMTHVPYRGGAQALSDVIAGHLPLMFNEPSSSIPHINSGKVRGLGVTSNIRVAAMPHIPTISESGLPGFEAVSWQMIVAPAKTPRDVVSRLHAELNSIMAAPEVHQQIIGFGMIPTESPAPDQLATFVLSEMDRWGKIVRRAGLASSE
jgi:tripartite-type tricarboxylate transporter receptor subunit TctC